MTKKPAISSGFRTSLDCIGLCSGGGGVHWNAELNTRYVWLLLIYTSKTTVINTVDFSLLPFSEMSMKTQEWRLASIFCNWKVGMKCLRWLRFSFCPCIILGERSALRAGSLAVWNLRACLRYDYSLFRCEILDRSDETFFWLHNSLCPLFRDRYFRPQPY